MPPENADLTTTGSSGVEYVRRAYDRAIDWYKVAESKSHILLTVNGAFVTILFGVLSGTIVDVPDLSMKSGVETWVFLGIVVIALTGAISTAAACLLSRHSHHIKSDFARLGVDPDVPDTYRPEALWYFGHLASLQFDPAVAFLRTADAEFEFKVLTYNLVGLARVVLRKHKLINRGWMLTTLALISVIAAGTSIIIRSQI
jgi:hypothetical protein